MPNADGKTSLAKGNYKVGPNNGGFANFSDDFAVGFTPLINEKFNELSEDSSQFTPSAFSLGNDGPGVDFFSNKDAPGFIKNTSWLGTYSVFNKSENSATSNDSWAGWNINESSLMTGEFNNQLDPGIPNAYDVEDSSYSPSDVPKYDAYNELPEPMLNLFQEFGSEYSTLGKLKDMTPIETPEANFASDFASANAQGGAIESMFVNQPTALNELAVGLDIEATGGGTQNLDALSQEMNLDQTLDSALNNINSDYNNDFNGIL